MLPFRRTVALLLAVALMLSFAGITVYSSDRQTSAATNGIATDSFSVNINTDQFITYLEENLMSCPKRLDVSSFGIPHTTQDAVALQRIIWHGTPVLFHVNGIGYSDANGIIDYVYFTYHYTESEYLSMYEACVAKVNKMTADLKDNKAIDDVTKALLLHDRLITICEYDHEAVAQGKISNESQEMYGALVNGVATCQGYSYAYMYLLREVGIDSYICSSDALDHDWNIVMINGKKYHVDTTFDDPVHDVTGRVYHDHFMLSTSALKQADHNVNDFDSTPIDTTYDKYYWKNSNSEFQLIDNKLYYIDSNNDTLNRAGSNGSLCKVSDVWMTQEGNYWKGNYARLSSDGQALFYSLSDTVYLFDLTTLKSKVIYKPDFSTTAKYSIFGFTYDEGYLVLDLFDRPTFDADTKEKYQIRVPYDLNAPTASLSYTNDVAAYQTVSMNFSDDNGISGYYWGTDAVHSKNSYTATSQTSAEEYVSQSGTYYLTAIDSGGNLSNTVSVTFYSTELDAGSGSIGTPTVITAKGNSFVLPVPVRNGYRFLGWSKTNQGESFVTEVTPISDEVYYASWETDDNYIPDDEPDYVNRFTDVSDSAWYADAVAYCAKRGYINGVSQTMFSPNTYLTREQFVLILANIAGVKANSYMYADSGMKDVSIGKWYSGAIAWGVAKGYVKGVAADRFGLGQQITREQLARLFYVYAEDTGMDVTGRDTLSRFADAEKVSSWALENVQWAVDAGIISGMTADTIGPRGNATRAQTARMFMLFDKLR